MSSFPSIDLPFTILRSGLRIGSKILQGSRRREVLHESTIIGYLFDRSTNNFLLVAGALKHIFYRNANFLHL